MRVFCGLRSWAWCWVLLACLCLAGCTSASQRVSRQTPAGAATAAPSPAAASETSGISDTARAYLTRALDFIEANSIMVALHRVDWPALRSETMTVARDEHAQTPEDTYPAIRFALSGLGDHHSFLTPPSVALEARQGAGSGEPTGERLPGGMGYLSLPQFGASATSELAQEYIETAQHLIQQTDSSPTCGWIVDLRYNGGGDMWPMLVSVGPILGAGEVGAFVDGFGARQSWEYEGGKALLAGSVIAQTSGPTASLQRPMPPVALLFNHATASAAEAIVVAFQGRPNTRSFGPPTYGVPTGNIGKTLSDGAVLVVTDVFEVDRTGKVYSGSIAPDDPIAGIYTSHGDLSQPDDTLHAAFDWLRAEPACAAQMR